MSNKLFRKGLVGAALVGLAATAFAGTPAFADAGVLTLTPSAGSTYNTLVSSTFTLSSVANTAALPATGGVLDYLVTNTSGASVTATSSTGTVSLVKTDGTAITGATSALSSFVVHVAGAGSSLVNKLTLGVAGTSAASLGVKAWGDNVSGDSFNSEVETQSDARTINFLKVADATVTPTIDAITAGAQVTAHVTFGNDINIQQVQASTLAAYLNDNGGDFASNAGSPAGFALNTAKTAFDFTSTGLTTTAPHSIGFKVKVNGDAAATAANVVSSSAVYATVGKGSTAEGAVDWTIAKNANQTPNASGADTTDVRKGTASVTLTANVSKAAVSTSATAPAAAGATVKVSVYGAAFADTTTVISAGGKSSTAGSAIDFSYTTTADANGDVPVVITSNNGSVGNVSVTLTAPGTASALTSNVKYVNWTAAVAKKLVQTNALVSSKRLVTAGGTVVLNYSIVDQFGQVYTAGATGKDWAIKTTTTDTVNTSGVVGYTPVVNGTASVTASIAAGAVNTTEPTVAAELVQKDTGAAVSTYADVSANSFAPSTSGTALAVANTYQLVETFHIGTAATPATITTATNAVLNGTSSGAANSSTATAPLAVNATPAAVTLKAIDRRVDANSVASLAIDSGKAVYLTATVTNADGSVAAFTPVTVASPNLFFSESASADVYVTGGSYTVLTNSSGVFALYAFSNTSGTQVVTYTAGAATKSVNAYFAGVTSAGKTLTVTAPATATPGSSVVVSAKLVDKYGNGVKVVSTDGRFSFAVSGVGSATKVVETAADGTAQLNVTFAANETGTATITASYYGGSDANLANTAYTADIVTTTASIAVAAPAAPVVPSAAKTALAVGADQAQVGAAVDVIATATDAAGKAVAGVVVTFDTVGAGYLSATTATTDANGVAKVKLVGNVAGRNTLTATANGATAANAGVSFGAADANITVKGKRATVTYEFAGLAKVVVSVNGTRQPAVYPADDNEGTYSFNLKAGTSKIVVSIAGKTVDSKTVKIKK